MTTIYTALGTDDEMGVMYFASLDGVGYLGVSGIPSTAEDVETLRAYISGEGKKVMPMLLHRDLIANRFGGTFEEVDVEDKGEGE